MSSRNLPSPDSPCALVVGASGQVGAALVRQLGPAALSAGRRQISPGWLRLDLEEIAADPSALRDVFADHNITAVYCAAGATDVERCEADTAWAAAANHLGPLALARAARHIPFVFFSTDYVFDGRATPGVPAGPYAEDAPTHPLSVYGRSKLLGEQAILDAHPTALIIRTNVVFGPDPQRKNFLYTLQRLLSAGTPMRVATDQISTPTYNPDLARATIALVEAGATGMFNVSGPELFSRDEFARLAAGILGLDASLIEPVITADLHQSAPRPLRAGLRIEKLRSKLPNLPIHATEQGVRDWLQADTRMRADLHPCSTSPLG